MKAPPHPTNAELHAHMKLRQNQNRVRCAKNANENWMRDLLKSTGLKFTRQATWRCRLFDFWNHIYGVAVEVDGPEHQTKKRKRKDRWRDEYDYRRSGIVVLRVRNENQTDAELAVWRIEQLGTWEDRRERLGLNAGKPADRKKRAETEDGRWHLTEFLSTLDRADR